MKKMSTPILITLFFLLAVGLYPAKDIPYSFGTWDEELYGNHRVVIRVTQSADAVRVHIPWRRRDLNPEKKNIIIIDAKTGIRIRNIYRAAVNREFGVLIFEPRTVPGDYFVYYLPNTMTGRSNYPTIIYPEPEQAAEPGWLTKLGISPGIQAETVSAGLPEAEVLGMQSIDEFNSFSPMELIATAEETEELLARYPKASYLLFPEDRRFPIRMTDDLPSRWIRTGPAETFHGQASRGEFYAFQVGAYAFRESIKDIHIQFSALKCSKPRGRIPSSALRCVNLAGIDWQGRAFTKACAVEKGKVRPLWCGVQVPDDLPPGEYRGKVTIAPRGLEKRKITVSLNISEDVLQDAGDGEPWKHSRLRWLDSKIALDDDVVRPFTPLETRGMKISCLGRKATLGDNGFPESIVSYFTPEVTKIGTQGRDILASPVELIVENADGETLAWKAKEIRFTKQEEGAIAWESKNRAGSLTLDCRAQMEFDGFIEFSIRLSAGKTTKINDVRLEIPLVKEVARYMMGMGYRGGYRPEGYAWKWDQKKNQDSAWVGDVNAGLQFSLRDENYSRPLNTNFYLLKPLVMPRSWWNEGKGGCTFQQTDEKTFLVQAYSGSHTLRAGEELFFNFTLLITPFKVLDTEGQWSTRYYHRFLPVEEIAATGANTINVHHANDINPYINYPFLRPAEMKAYVDEAHRKGLKVKIYYTVRELSNRAPEIFALRSLDDEILSYGPGGGFSWLQEHLGSNYIAGWFVPRLKDAAVINSGVSRWHNYYLEGLNWLVKNVGIDGLYIDDVAFDRTVMKRVRKILDQGREGALIDLHSANQFNVRDGYANSANLYLEHFPYLNRLWFGEYFDYNSKPDFWLVEVSGIPFGLMGEMLQDGGNPWRGMVYGMTSRLPWSGNPSSIWKAWDEFGIQEAEMVGCWSPRCPVKTGQEDILATAYIKKDSVLVAVASWAESRKDCQLNIDWNALGLDAQKARITAPFIRDFQEKAVFKPADRIPVLPGRGWLLILRAE